MVVVNIPGSDISYYMNERLKKNIDDSIIPALHKKDKDYVLTVDGTEGSGKSWLAFQIGKYVDPSLNLDRVCFNSTQFKKAILKAKAGECVIYDEAFTGLSSRGSISTINRMLVSLMMQMRQKNLFVVIVLPTFFLLDKYVAIFRAKILIHVFESKGKRGYFLVFNRRKKKTLYLLGKQLYTYSKVRTDFIGIFRGKFALGDKEVEAKYRKLKAQALESMEEDQGKRKVGYHVLEQRDRCILALKLSTKLSNQSLSDSLKIKGVNISPTQVGEICRTYAKIPENPAK